MSYIRLNITDHDRTVSGEVHGGVGDAVIASLSAEPESIHELELALARFQKPADGWSALASLRDGRNFEPYDAGIMIVDLAAQVAMIDSTYSAPAWSNSRRPSEAIDFSAAQSSFKVVDQFDVIEAEQRPARQRDVSTDHDTRVTLEINYHDGEKRTSLRLLYQLPDTWMFVGSVPEYKGVCPERRAERRQAVTQALDTRAVLFGRPLSEFIATEMLNAPDLEAEDLFTEIHARWLVGSRADLGGRSPREVLVSKKEWIDFDLHARELQWSMTGECPPALLPTAYAYRFAGFGTHEIVIYYDLIRLLLDESYKRASEGQFSSIEEETDRLEQIKNAWLEMPNPEDHGKSPALISDWERRRIPLVLSGQEAIIDENCPVCRAMAEDLETPMFWHLDGCHMDDRFEFSFFLTQEEWEVDHRRREEFDREFNRRVKARAAQHLPDAHVFGDEAEPF